LTDQYAWWTAALAGTRGQISADEQWQCAGEYNGVMIDASTMGRIRRSADGMVYTQKLDRGYFRIRVRGKFIKVHRVIAKTFIPNPENMPYTNHLNGVKSNNLPSNLEWCTPVRNVRHAHALGLVPYLEGEDNPASKLTDDEVVKIRARYKPGIVRQVDLAAEFGVSQRMISLIVRREKWTHV